VDDEDPAPGHVAEEQVDPVPAAAEDPAVAVKGEGESVPADEAEGDDEPSVKVEGKSNCSRMPALPSPTLGLSRIWLHFLARSMSSMSSEDAPIDPHDTSHPLCLDPD
jgi:hypothetical protein